MGDENAQSPGSGLENGLKVSFDVAGGIDAERAAMLLALTRTREEEDEVKRILSKVRGLKFAVTELGGMSDALRSKIGPQVVGACLSQEVIRKRSSDTHALLHALIEAERGLLTDAPMSASMSMKIAVVRQGSWIVCAIFGHSAFHVLTNHRRAGLGAMHLD
ncbi:MAG: HutP family protein [Firmicutes bacterium]|nr:HutP family protein [Bacillota bacterium]